MWRATCVSSAPERIIDHRFVKCGVAHAGADAQRLAVAVDAVELGDLVDVDQMRRLGQPERHDRHQALAAGQHAAVLRRDLARIVTASSTVRGTWRMNGAGFMAGLEPRNRLYANDLASAKGQRRPEEACINKIRPAGLQPRTGFFAFAIFRFAGR